ncbi:group II intron reverse transcriptase/maturase [Gracilibacillus sp. YIM 98692]|uniref:group II intron reverse transcriptase/maturase n=1 Tax=Gracilibacillus sp. YIM 98692 TaxID=2663532 RepID=UPI0013D1ADB5|nr:group II intron reverse transcriptase/maturase [Gracilibacillus sp. YIM 98692]
MANKGPSEKKLRHVEYYGLQDTFDDLYAESKQGKTFKKLMQLITSKNNILLAYRNLKRNSGSPTAGVDGITIYDIEKLSESEFIKIVRKRFSFYNPRKVKRVEIPKPNGKKRPLGIPSLWDRIAQQSILQILEPICEAKFNKHSYGFRPNRSTEHAIADLNVRINRGYLHYVVDVDIKGFFDEVSHTKLMRQMWTMGIRDKQLLVIIRRMLKAPIVLPNGKTIYPKKGTPQGGVLSPLLANVYLNEFDWWIAHQWEERNLKELKPLFKKSGERIRSYEYKKMRKTTGLKEIYFVRYADDFKIICRNRNTAERIFMATKDWLNERLKLSISEEKSGVTNLIKRTCEFLGFSIKAIKKGKQTKNANKYVVKSHVSPKAIKRINDSLKSQINKIQQSPNSHKTIEEIIKYNSMVIGIHNYYRIATHCNEDFSKLHKHINRTMYNRFRKKGYTRHGNYDGKDKGLKPYLKSKRLRYLMETPILPIGYIQTKKPLNKRTAINKYTPEGRKLIHKELTEVPEWKIKWLRDHPTIGRNSSIEYLDNRISKFIAQKGKCGVTKVELLMNEIHCHHIVPYHLSQDDSYQNLIIVRKDIHKLIHATKSNTIKELISAINLKQDHLDKLNELRTTVGNEPIQS